MDPRTHSASTPPAETRTVDPIRAVRIRADLRFRLAVKLAEVYADRTLATIAGEGPAELAPGVYSRAIPVRLGDYSPAEASEIVREYTRTGPPAPREITSAEVAEAFRAGLVSAARALAARESADYTVQSRFQTACIARPDATGRTDLPVRSETPGRGVPATVSRGVPAFWDRGVARAVLGSPVRKAPKAGPDAGRLIVGGSAVGVQTAYRLAGQDRHADGSACEGDCAGCLRASLETALSRAQDHALPQRIRRNYARVAHSLARQLASARDTDRFAQGSGE